MLASVPSESTKLLLVAGGLVVVSIVLNVVRLTSRWKGAPPGPPTLPFVGNLHQMPKKDLHIQYDKWAREYGPIFSLKWGSQNVIVLASGKMIKNLVDKKGSMYADRPKMYMQDIWEGSRIIMRGYDALWKVERKLYHQFLNVNKATRYIPYQDLESKQLLLDLLSDPGSFEELITRSQMSVACSMVYGFRVLDRNSPVMQELLHTMHGFFVMVRNSKLLDWFPQLRLIVGVLPSWLYPTAKVAKQMFYREKALFHKLYDKARKDFELNSARPSFSGDISTAQRSWKDQAALRLLNDHAASYIAGIAMEAGTDTTSNTLAAFIKAMMLHPHIQRKAQAEIDSTVRDRLPTMEDFDSLPYMRQIIKEVLRWLPTSVTGAVPHATFTDDEIDGYKIPAGTSVVLAVWSANNDPDLFPNPRKFDPSRHDPALSLSEAAASADYRNRDHWTFGAGRRICPGMHVAESSLFLFASRLLWAFDFRKPRTADGTEIEVDPDELTQSIAARPIPFRCDIRARSEVRKAIVTHRWEEAKVVLGETGQYKEAMI